jgi:hypothetical protein
VAPGGCKSPSPQQPRETARDQVAVSATCGFLKTDSSAALARWRPSSDPLDGSRIDDPVWTEVYRWTWDIARLMR